MLRFEFHCTAVQSDRPASDGQSETGSAGGLRTALVDAVEALENIGPMFGGNPGTVVLDLHQRALCGATFYANRDFSAGLRILNRIRDQVDQGLLERGLVQLHVQFGLALKDQRLQLLFGQYVQAIDNVQRDFLETDQVEIQRKLRRFCSRQNQQVIQQARQSIDFFQSASDGIRMANCVSAVLQRILAQPPGWLPTGYAVRETHRL